MCVCGLFSCRCVCVEVISVYQEEVFGCTYVCASGCVNYSREAEKGVSVCVCAVPLQQEEVCVYVVYLCV